MPRNWREIGADMSKAKDDLERLSQLVREFEEALKADQQGFKTDQRVQKNRATTTRRTHSRLFGRKPT
jgi:hypothetical protein